MAYYSIYVAVVYLMGIKEVFYCETAQDAFIASALINAVCVGVAIEIRQLSGDATIMPAVVATCFVSYMLVYMSLYKWAGFGQSMVAPPVPLERVDGPDGPNGPKGPKAPRDDGLRSSRLIS